VWEQVPTDLGDKPAIQNATATYLGRLVPLARAVLLLPGCTDILLANGLDYPSFPDFEAEPSATIVKRRDKEEHYPLGAGTKAIWRQLPALVVRRKAGTIGGALTLAGMSDTQSFDLWVGALLSDKASILDTVESVCHVPARMLTDAGRAEYEQEVQSAEHKASALGSAIVKWREIADGGWPGRKKSDPKASSKIQASAARHYWAAVERALPHLTTLVTTDGEAREAARTAWHTALRAAALAAFELACSRETPRQLRAFALARAVLSRKPKATAETEPNEESE
jgi:CRISPR system Cascade subunit CasA